MDPEVNLRIENLSHVLLGSIDGRAADLVKIASYAYSADQSVSRGGEADVYGRKWHRQMRLVIPVSDPRFWQRRSLEDGDGTVLEAHMRWSFQIVGDERPVTEADLSERFTASFAGLVTAPSTGAVA